MWQPLLGIDLEFNTLLKVNQVKLDFGRTVVKRQIRNQRMKQGRLTRTAGSHNRNKLTLTDKDTDPLENGDVLTVQLKFGVTL